jgi:hypothetical protein
MRLPGGKRYNLRVLIGSLHNAAGDLLPPGTFSGRLLPAPAPLSVAIIGCDLAERNPDRERHVVPAACCWA